MPVLLVVQVSSIVLMFVSVSVSVLCLSGCGRLGWTSSISVSSKSIICSLVLGELGVVLFFHVLFFLGISMSMLESSGFVPRTAVCLLSDRAGGIVGLVCSKGGSSSSFTSVHSLLSGLAFA